MNRKKRSMFCRKINLVHRKRMSAQFLLTRLAVKEENKVTPFSIIAQVFFKILIAPYTPAKLVLVKQVLKCKKKEVIMENWNLDFGQD